jgi:hypothetical protein
MDVLDQVAALLRVSFVGYGQPFECGPELSHCVPVQVILIRLFGGNGSSHTQDSRERRRFLTWQGNAKCGNEAI